ncbi:hypothetical protein Fsol_00655 [Candidatus Fokinia solitaria]|uniref:Uncharacterized protein n=1 Tax=Candidatus Fokinia solitaria TaxID=1802984 RepID=A0A2U8BSY1_9RICK|nr:hypothetical protein [Candidatus Fokinia solitaria]AWD33433.1 hypothetical protein Fsol_00655 [Candidatus Fokinia solitaria]
MRVYYLILISLFILIPKVREEVAYANPGAKVASASNIDDIVVDDKVCAGEADLTGSSTTFTNVYSSTQSIRKSTKKSVTTKRKKIAKKKVAVVSRIKRMKKIYKKKIHSAKKKPSSTISNSAIVLRKASTAAIAKYSTPVVVASHSAAKFTTDNRNNALTISNSNKTLDAGVSREVRSSKDVECKNEIGIGIDIGRNIGHSLQLIDNSTVERNRVVGASLYNLTLSLSREVQKSKTFAVLVGAFLGSKFVAGDILSGRGMMFGVSSKLLMLPLSTESDVHIIPYVEGQLGWSIMSYTSLKDVIDVSSSSVRIIDRGDCEESEGYRIRGKVTADDVSGMYGAAVAGIRITDGNVIVSFGAKIEQNFQNSGILDATLKNDVVRECSQYGTFNASKSSTDRTYVITPSSISKSGSTSLYGIIELSYKF